ncbi:RNA-directed DNA polymerase, eukaryota, Reverse transcriptase zinc-binding domain protein [Artemisia annua]|uniref:RNA-directed DNA polymerase, eukaryota, Reverse transcriptase zinc-binding domain protein n=1 Tax=Artemisia annua TaxID=35608 RepID=A0A2U1L6A4_ARTAN|nr:RNA-directed DNA polymerase, eukaryota, Reverse transcriptase zinc-binding domain protein [Artemisia annua]
MACPFCKQCKDSHSHLFFSCMFTRRLWERLKSMAGLDNISNIWAQNVSGIVNFPAKNTIWNVIQRLVWGASVYFIWQERNMRLFDGHSRTEDQLFKVITEAVKFRIMGLKLKFTPDVLKAAEDLVWFQSTSHCSCLLIWSVDEISGHNWYFQDYIGNIKDMMVFYCLTSHINWFNKPYYISSCSRVFPQGWSCGVTWVDNFLIWCSHAGLRDYYGQCSVLFMAIYIIDTFNLCTLFPLSIFFPQGFLMRQSGRMITSLVFILHYICTAGLQMVGIFLLVVVAYVVVLHEESEEVKIWTVH